MNDDQLDPLPEPDGWIYDGHPDGLQFKRQAVAGIEALVRSSAPMFTAHQMRAYAAKQVAAEQDRIRSLLALCSKETADVVGKYLDAAKREQP